jgi:hypothetical protein
MGYGDPHHAAFYPNCQGIFGMRDPHINGDTNLSVIRYEVYGWYSDKDKDILHKFIQTHNEREDWLNALEQELEWTTSHEGQLPDRIICHSKISFTQSEAPSIPSTLRDERPTEVAIGNTATEALSAFLAHRGDMDRPAAQIENQLESLHLQSYLNEKQTDLGAVFEEARHTNAFKPISGGRIWTFKPEGNPQTEQSEGQDQHRRSLEGRLFLPPGMEEQLHQANILQHTFNQANEAIRDLQRQVVIDWQKYMRSTYHSIHHKPGTYPPIDDARRHVEKMMVLLAYKKAFAGTIQFDEDNKVWTANSEEPPPLPGRTDLEDLLPGLSAEFLAWYQATTAEQPAPALAEQMSTRLNAIADGLHNYNRIIETLRQFQQRLKDSPPGSFAQLGRITAAVEQEIQEYTTATNARLPASNLRAQITGKSDPKAAVDSLTKYLQPLAALPKIQLIATAAPRYWQAKAPVVLLSGPALQPTDRYGKDGVDPANPTVSDLLICQPVTGVRAADTVVNIVNDTVIQQNTVAHQTDGAPWHPLFFEWEVRIDPLRNLSNRRPETLQYHEDFITSNYTLKEKKSEFLKSESFDTAPGASYFSGRATLLPFAQELLEKEIENYLIKEAKAYVQWKSQQPTENPDDPPLSEKEIALLNYTIGDQLESRPTEAAVQQLDDQTEDIADTEWADTVVSEKQYRHEWLQYFMENTSLIKDFYHDNLQIRLGEIGLDQVEAAQFSLLETLLAVRDNLNKGLHMQTQMLSGFNEALLGLKKTVRLEIAEPNGFEEYAAFSKRVAAAVGRMPGLTAGLKQDFHPIRNGKLHLIRLKVVDTFGQTHSVVDRTRSRLGIRITTPERLSIPDDDEAILLPPRITQPARLHFRWLAANDHALESNSHPDTSPICGWIMVNKMDVSLMVYDADGYLLGAVEKTGRWRVAPGNNWPITNMDVIPNAALRKLVKWISARAAEIIDPESGTTFMAHYLDDLEVIMNDIAPDHTTDRQAKALLMGRPIALVQASVDIHLKGLPAVNQDMGLFSAIVKGAIHQVDAFTDVNIPIRIGERKQLNDGLVGYWLDSDNGYTEGQMRAPFNAEQHDVQSKEEMDALTFYQSIAAPAQRLAILMDPRGLLHCTTGMLPTKALSIPTAHFMAALERIQLTFLVAPLLSEPGKINIPLPQETGYSWAWLQREEGQWSELSNKPMLRKADLLRAYENGTAIWDLLLENGWIEYVDGHPQLAYIRKANERSTPTLLQDEKQQEDLEKVLTLLARYITPPKAQAGFSTPMQIREGWLVLRPENNL